MTICIAAISDAKDIFTIADKMFTNSQGVTSGYQINENKKIVAVGDTCVAMFAGNIVNANEVLSLAKGTIETADSIKTIAEKIKIAYSLRLRTAINDEILSKYGLDIDSFNAQQKLLDPTFISSVINTIDHPNSTLDIQIIIAGKDKDGPQLYKVSHPGTISNETPIGYSSIGSGSSHASLSLIDSQVHPGIKFDALTYAMLRAKRKAEYDPNVGVMSAIALITKRVEWLDNAMIGLLWKVYESSVSDTTAIIKASGDNMKGIIYGSRKATK
jgi:20S proteasome alpha/beta subunit